jgi:hypothetical protein
MVLTFLAADKLTRLYHVSDMEGGRGMLLVFIYAPAGLLAGLVVGWIVARHLQPSGLAGWGKAGGVALLAVAALIGAVFGLAWLAADHPPTLGGRPVHLELQIRLPDDAGLPEDLHAADLHASLDEGTRANRFAQLALDSAAVRDGYLVVPGIAWLFTQNRTRDLLVGLGTENSSLFELPLGSRLAEADTAWSPWLTSERAADLSRPASGRHFEVRVRAVRSPEK